MLQPGLGRLGGPKGLGKLFRSSLSEAPRRPPHSGKEEEDAPKPRPATNVSAPEPAGAKKAVRPKAAVTSRDSAPHPSEAEGKAGQGKGDGPPARPRRAPRKHSSEPLPRARTTGATKKLTRTGSGSGSVSGSVTGSGSGSHGRPTFPKGATISTTGSPGHSRGSSPSNSIGRNDSGGKSGGSAAAELEPGRFISGGLGHGSRSRGHTWGRSASEAAGTAAGKAAQTMARSQSQSVHSSWRAGETEATGGSARSMEALEAALKQMPIPDGAAKWIEAGWSPQDQEGTGSTRPLSQGQELESIGEDAAPGTPAGALCSRSVSRRDSGRLQRRDSGRVSSPGSEHEGRGSQPSGEGWEGKALEDMTASQLVACIQAGIQAGTQAEGQRGSGDGVDLAAAAGRLRVLARDSQCVAKRVVDAGALGALTELLQGRDEGAVEQAATAVFNLTVHDGLRGRVAHHPGLIRALAAALACPCAAAQSSAAAALCCMTADAREEVWNAGVLGPLLHIVQDVTDASAKKDAMRCLFSLSMAKEHRGAIAQAGAVPVLCAVLEEEQYDLDTEVAGVLAALSRDGAGRAAMREAGAVVALAELLETGASQCSKEYAVTALLQLAAKCEACLEAIFRADVTLPLDMLSRCESVETQVKARALLAFLRDWEATQCPLEA